MPMGRAPHFPSCRFLLDEIKVCDGPGLVENRLKIVRQKWGVPWHGHGESNI
jgi:hypothetical protein